MKRNTYNAKEKPEEAAPKLSVGQFKRLALYALPHKKIFMLVFTLVVFSSVISFVPSFLLRHIINEVIPTQDERKLYTYCGGLLLLALLQIVIPWIYGVLLRVRTDRIIAQIRDDFFDKLQALSFDYFDRTPVGKITVCATGYIDNISEFFANYLVSFIVNILQIVIVTVCMLVISPILSAVIYGSILPLLLCFTLLRRKSKKLFRRLNACDSNRAAFTQESIQGERIIKSFNRSAQNEVLYRDVVHGECLHVWYKTFLNLELFNPTFELFWNAASILLYFVAIVCMQRGVAGMDAGTIILFINYLGYCSGPFLSFSSILQNLASVSSYLERIFAVMDTPCTIADKEDAVELSDVRGKVEFDHVTFGYKPGITILDDINLSVNPGEMIALVGPTGAGKTTFINLLTRFYEANEGQVRLDGRDVRDYTLHSLRTHVGVIMQDPFIFKGTLIDNIRYGKPDATDEECIRAAELIHADKVINRFPEKYQHLVGENGDGLSAGEKQMLSMARIILKNPAVIILDEATSSIDSENEHLIQEALSEVLKGKTSFVVAHRLSTIRSADRILYIADHGIAEEGNHEQLMAKKGLYYKLNQRV